MTPDETMTIGGLGALAGGYVLTKLAGAVKNRLSRRAIRSRGGIAFADEFFTWPDICRHFLFLGGTGAGKTWASDLLIRSVMGTGRCPMLLASVTPDYFERTYNNAKKAGQASRVTRISDDSPHRMNLLESLLKPHGSPTVAAGLMTKIGRVGKPHTGGGDGNQAFFETQAERAIAASIVVCRKMRGHSRITDCHKLLMSSPPDLASLNKPEWDPAVNNYENGKPIVRGFCAQLMVEASRGNLAEGDPAFANACDYLLREMPGAGDRMHGSIIAEINNTLGRFVDPPWDTALSSNTTITPQDILDNNLIAVVDAPVLVGLTPARMFTYAWTMEMQRTCLRRIYKEGTPPLVLVRDEVGWLINGEWDAQVAIVARARGLAQIDIVQDINTLLMGLGGQNAKDEAWAFINNHMSKLCFGTDSMETAKWASAMIGQHREIMLSGHPSDQPHHEGGSVMDSFLGVGSSGCGWSEQMMPIWRPEQFSQMAVGTAIMLAKGQANFVDFRDKKRR